jgi:hypothetical protein
MAAMNPWLGPERGHLSDWTTQRWVRATGRRTELADAPWLRGPAAPPEGVGPGYFERYARENGLTLLPDEDSAGLLPRFDELRGGGFDPGAVDPRIVDFYERTARFELQLWSQWSSAFRPFGRLIDAIFSRRLGQLQLPMAPLDTSRGVSSKLVALRGDDGSVETAWLRRRLPAGEVIYAGFYSTARPPLADGPCVKVVFPLPNGNASVFLRPVARADGSLELISPAARFGGPGFYFVVDAGDGSVWARTVPLTESIHVYGEGAELHTDHVLRLWGRVFLELHYVMRV